MATLHKLKPRRSLRPMWVLVTVALLVVLVHVWIDRLYGLRLHVALGYGGIYSKNMTFELVSRYGGAVIYALLGWLVIRKYRHSAAGWLYAGLTAIALFLGWVIGFGLWALDAPAWYLFFHHQPFGKTDPLMHLDYSFYVYQLPLIIGVIGRVVFTVILWLIMQLLYLGAAFTAQHLVAGAKVTPTSIHRNIRSLFALGGVVFLGFAAFAFLNRYETMLAPGNGSFIFGPDFFTARLFLPVFSWLQILGLLLVSGSLFYVVIAAPRLFPLEDGFVRLTFKPFKRPMQAFGTFLVLWLISPLTSAVLNALYVHPNQNTVELPYIGDSIDATRWALGINHVAVQPFEPDNLINQADITRDQNALKNVRINDQGQTTAIYNQLQSFKSYFQFATTSVDRYDGKEVYVSARQMNVNNLPVQTWINRTLVYTHGYGIAASPVNQFDQDGLPTLWAKNTPQETVSPIPKLTRPQIYFGTMNNDVIAPSKQDEFDYPLGSADAASHYTGGYALPIQGNRWLLALEQGTLKFFTSDQLTSHSQWLFDRNIYQRVQDIAPFLRYDRDVFPFVDSSGHLLWMLDAYTETPNIPYAQSFMGTAYIRNSVKVVMDAYTGKTTFYVVNPKDPMLQSLMENYPGLFTSKIPADVKAHFRYPQDLFQAQSAALTRYHMTDPSAFYNQEDLWAVANQIYQQDQVAPRPPVYQMIRMPDQSKPHFVISTLFTPNQKDNLNGWLIVDNEPAHYGQFTLYQFSQSSLIFGPMQAENQIDANPTISQQLTLWNQQGSQVVRGDVLLIPVGNSLLYVEPVYLVANRQNSLPQLERVIVDFNKQVYIDTSLAAALSDMLSGGQGTLPSPNVPGGAAPGASQGGTQGQGGKASATIQQANQLFQQYQQDTAKGDLAAAGQDLQKLGSVLQSLLPKSQTKAK